MTAALREDSPAPVPEPRPPTLLEAAWSEAGKSPRPTWLHHPGDLVEALRSAEWSSERLRAELPVEGWLGRLQQEVAQRRGSVIARQGIARVLSTGPVAMVEVDASAALAKLPAKLREIVQTWTPGQGGLLLLGPTGAGKTLAAALTVHRLVREEAARHVQHQHGFAFRPEIRWARAADLGLARQGHPLGKGEPEAITAATEARLLVLDDLGWDTRPDAVSDVLAWRYDAGRVTLVTSGRTAPELQERYGDAVVRRIVEVGGKRGRIVPLFGKVAPCG